MTERNLYSGVFFNNGLHMTWEFGQDCALPDNISVGDEQIVQLYAVISERALGLYACFIEIGGEKTYDQPNSDNPLHITLYTGEDASGLPIAPKEAGILLKSYKKALSHNHTPLGYSPLNTIYTWMGQWGFYKI